MRDKAALQLRQGLQDLFDNADDTLFEMADKAFDRGDQNLYFEAMRDLRLKRKSIERGFLDTFHDAFLRAGQVDLLANLAQPGKPRSKAQMERAAAIEGMVARVLSRDGVALQQLGLRLQALLDRPCTSSTTHWGQPRCVVTSSTPGVIWALACGSSWCC